MIMSISKRSKKSIYPDKKHRMPKFEMNEEEITLYFADNSQVKVFDENGEFYLGVIKSANLPKNILSVKKRGSNGADTIYITRVMRLL